MKKTGFIIIMSIISSVVAALPVQWDFFQYTVKEDKNVVTPEIKNGKLYLADGKIISPVKIKAENNFFDFNKLAKGNNHAVLRTVFNCENARQTHIGIGGLAFAIELNGKIIYDFRRKGLGNDYDPVSVNDHVIPLEFKKGENTLTVYSCRTNWLLDFCYGANREIKWDLAIAEIKDFKSVKAELAGTEILLRPTAESILFSFITKEPVHAGIDYREAGSAKWQRVWDLAGDLVLRNDRRNHVIRLEELKPGTCYEYRIVMLEPVNYVEPRSLWTARNYQEVFTEVKEFSTPGGGDLKFFVFGDTQLSLSENCSTIAQRDVFMDKMKSADGFKNADFIVHVGDLTSYYHSVEKNLFQDFFYKFKFGKTVKPWIYVRGNHELNGIGAVQWHDYFMMPDEKPYYSFKVDDVYFIVLACSDFSKGLNASNGPVISPDTMVRKQRAWLEKVVKNDEFKKAKFRIVLSHTAPQLENSESVVREIQEIIEPLKDELIHFWIAGHSHYYWRMFKGSDILYSRNEWKKAPAYAAAKFNWITLDGPKGSNSKPDFSYLTVNIKNGIIQAVVTDEDGKLIDSFNIDAKGNAVELKRSPDIKPFKLPSE